MWVGKAGWKYGKLVRRRHDLWFARLYPEWNAMDTILPFVGCPDHFSSFFSALILEPLCIAQSITNTRSTIGSRIFTDFLPIVHPGTKPTPMFTTISSSIFLIETKLSVPSYALLLEFESRVNEVLLEEHRLRRPGLLLSPNRSFRPPARVPREGCSPAYYRPSSRQCGIL